ncbi:39S ribosomal protein L10, mitochondrial isoform X1 [Fopius arisanus]|uniref:Large ribosomal subunit protein uL10m n=2 Tax=Fopius arisanus TaxID=64838 RepID=A0A9R1TPU6_9HYME|nr:PREDICTED: 39S ribosomal protein L10, mitochondrial isoform X1 [Fopius arisanus]
MSLITTKVFRCVQRSLVIEQRRYKSKINIQKPRKPFYTRGVFNEFVTPFWPAPRERAPLWELCGNVKKAQKKIAEPHPYEMILAKECLNWYNNSRMIAFLHKNSIKAEDELDLRIALKRENMCLKYWEEKISTFALTGTPYEAVLPLFCSRGVIIFGPEPNVEKLRKCIKQWPQYILMAGILDGRLLNVNDFLKYGSMDITSARTQLVQTLQSAAGANLCRQLTHHQETLVTRLGQIGKGETKDPLPET